MKTNSGEKSNRFSPNKTIFFQPIFNSVFFAENKFAEFVGIPLYRRIFQKCFDNLPLGMIGCADLDEFSEKKTPNGL